MFKKIKTLFHPVNGYFFILLKKIKKKSDYSLVLKLFLL